MEPVMKIVDKNSELKEIRSYKIWDVIYKAPKRFLTE